MSGAHRKQFARLKAAATKTKSKAARFGETEPASRKTRQNPRQINGQNHGKELRLSRRDTHISSGQAGNTNLAARDCYYSATGCFFADSFGFVCAFPCKAWAGAAEVAVGCCWAIDGTAQS